MLTLLAYGSLVPPVCRVEDETCVPTSANSAVGKSKYILLKKPECWRISFCHKVAIPLGEMVYCSKDICGVGPED